MFWKLYRCVGHLRGRRDSSSLSNVDGYLSRIEENYSGSVLRLFQLIVTVQKEKLLSVVWDN